MVRMIFVLISMLLPMHGFASDSAYIGKYKIRPKSCDVSELDAYSQVVVKEVAGYRQGDRQTPIALQFMAYNDAASETLWLPLEDYVNHVTGVGGSETWSVQKNKLGLTVTRDFIRSKQSGWPDFDETTTYYLEVVEYGLRIRREGSQSRDGKFFFDEDEVCELESLLDDERELKFYDLDRLTHSSLNRLDSIELGSFDLDQAAIQFEKAWLSSADLSLTQVKELLAVQLLPIHPGYRAIQLKPVHGNESATEIAEKGLATALGLAEGENIQEYKTLYLLRDDLAQVIGERPPGLLIYLVEWSEANSDGEGVLFIDTINNQAFYLGSAYFE